MIAFFSKKYQQIINLNFLFAIIITLSNLYLYPKLPSIVPTYFPLFGPPNNPGGKIIIWVFPLIFLVFRILFNIDLWEKISLFSILNKDKKKTILIIFQLLLWISALNCYLFYYSLISVLYRKKYFITKLLIGEFL